MLAHIVTKPDCPFCVKAKEFLTGLDIKYFEELYTEELWSKIQKKFPDVKTVPQIWMKDEFGLEQDVYESDYGITHIGGYDDLVEWSLK